MAKADNLAMEIRALSAGNEIKYPVSAGVTRNPISSLFSGTANENSVKFVFPSWDHTFLSKVQLSINLPPLTLRWKNEPLSALDAHQGALPVTKASRERCVFARCSPELCCNWSYWNSHLSLLSTVVYCNMPTTRFHEQFWTIDKQLCRRVSGPCIVKDPLE